MLGKRLRFAREAAGLRQSRIAEVLGLSKSGVSDIEHGRRPLKAAQLAKLAELYHRPIDFFFTDQPLRKDFVLWRCKPDAEAEAKRIQRSFFELCENYRRLEELTGQVRASTLPDVPAPQGDYTHGDAESLALKTSEELDLGPAPAEVLPHVLEERCSVRVFALKMQTTTSGLCMRDDVLGASILLNQDNVSWRRNFDLAHELFHLLVWRIFRKGDQNDAEVASNEEESLANVFASRLLLPEGPFRQKLHELSRAGHLTVADVHEMARQFDVSSEAVVYRMRGFYGWDEATTQQVVGKVKEFYAPREAQSIDSLPERYVYLAVLAYRKGLISYGRAAKYLRVGHREARSILEPPEDEFDLETPIPTTAH